MPRFLPARRLEPSAVPLPWRLLDGGLAVLLVALFAFATAWAQIGAPYDGAGPQPLRAAWNALRDDPALDVFGRPLVLQSREVGDRWQGDVHAALEVPYPDLRRTLVQPDEWCRILLLHLNVHYCRATDAPRGRSLAVGLGRKREADLDDLRWIDFAHHVARQDEDYLAVELLAASGPFGTRDVRILVEATALSAGRSLLHLRYAQSHGMAARLAMQAYLSTLGAGKTGFSTVVHRDGRSMPVEGLRGALERNTMRYYLAVEAYLGARHLPPSTQFARSVQDAFAASERYPQLHELERDEYVPMKLRELARQATEPPPARR
jgi:hypothetical protein